LQERYKVLNAQEMTTKGMGVGANTNGFIPNTNVIVWIPPAAVPGLSPHWNGTKQGAGADYGGMYTWDEAKALTEDDFGDYPPEAAGNGPTSYTYANRFYCGSPIYHWFWDFDVIAADGIYELGPFPTNQAHSAIVKARSIAFANGFTPNGAIGPENVWIEIINVTNSFNEWEYSASYGGNAFPVWCGQPAEPGTSGTGNVSQVTYETWYDDAPGHWEINGETVADPVLDSRCSEYSKTVTLSTNNVSEGDLTALKSAAETAFSSATIVAGGNSPYAYASITRSGTAPTNLYWSVTLSRSYGVWQTAYISTNVPHGEVEAYLRGQTSNPNWVYDANGDAGATTDTYKKMGVGTEAASGTSYKFTFGDDDLPVPNWPDTPTNNTTATKGYITRSRTCYIPWDFYYCDEKFW
jgi:hypothetical protein